MGTSECYCALCQGPLGARHVELGSTSRGHLNRRRRRVSRPRQAKEAGQEFDLVASDSEHDSDPFSDDEENDFYEDCRFDPHLVSEERTEWLDEYQALGLNFCAIGGARFVLTCFTKTEDVCLLEYSCRAFISCQAYDDGKVSLTNSYDGFLRAKSDMCLD
jgi:hypothetical protein